TKPLHSLRHIAYEYFLNLEKIPLNIITPDSIDSSSFIKEKGKNFLSQIYAHIDSALLCHKNIKKELKSIALKLDNETLLTFYTD
ncbi:1082_t:CDS:1, partial [Rhizophagus irregularis]